MKATILLLFAFLINLSAESMALTDMGFGNSAAGLGVNPIIPIGEGGAAGSKLGADTATKMKKEDELKWEREQEIKMKAAAIEKKKKMKHEKNKLIRENQMNDVFPSNDR